MIKQDLYRTKIWKYQLMGCPADEAVIVDDMLFSQEVAQGVVDGLGGQWQAVELCQVVATAVAEQLED